MSLYYSHCIVCHISLSGLVFNVAYTLWVNLVMRYWICFWPLLMDFTRSILEFGLHANMHGHNNNILWWFITTQTYTSSVRELCCIISDMFDFDIFFWYSCNHPNKCWQAPILSVTNFCRNSSGLYGKVNYKAHHSAYIPRVFYYIYLHVYQRKPRHR